MSRSWQFDSTARSAAVSITEAATLDIRDPARAIADFAIEPKNRAPLHIHLARPWVLLDFDHGLGGGKLMSELIAAMTSDALGFSEPLPPTVCRRPGLRALAHTTRVTPGRLVQAVCDLPSLSKQPVCGEPQPLYQQPDLVYVGSDPEFLRRVRARRDRDFPDVSVLALITSATLRALTSFGIETHPSVLVVIDLGRHLPVGVGTLSNFLGFAPVSVASPISAQAISDQIEAYTNGCRSLVRYQLRALTRLRHPIRKSVIRRSDDRRARLVVTDHGESLGSRKIRWAGPEEGRIFVRYAAPLESSNEITLATNRIGDQLHLTATFYSTQFDRESVRAALLRVVNGIDGSDVDRKLATAP
jgi:hypothetical protein